MAQHLLYLAKQLLINPRDNHDPDRRVQWAGIGLCQCRGNLILRNAAECELASGDKKRKSWFMNIWYLAPGTRMMETVTRDMWDEWGTGIMCPVSRLWWHLHDDSDCVMHHVWRVYTVHWPPLGMCGARCWASDVSWHVVTSPPLLVTAECPPLVTFRPSALPCHQDQDQACSGVSEIGMWFTGERKQIMNLLITSRVNIIIIWCFDRLPRPVICQARCSRMGTHEHLS